MNALKARSTIWILPLASLLLLRMPEASAVSFGSLSDWATTYSGTISLDDKNFILLGTSGSWDNSESVNLAFFPALNAHTFGIDSLEGYVGPQTLTIDYRVDITSSNVFAAVGMDQDVLLPGVTTTKDIYASLADLQSATNAVATLSIVDFVPIPPPPVFLPALQSIWVRDTIQLSTNAAVQSISNTYIQEVPEPGTLLLAAAGAGLAALRRAVRRSPAVRGERPPS